MGFVSPLTFLFNCYVLCNKYINISVEQRDWEYFLNFHTVILQKVYNDMGKERSLLGLSQDRWTVALKIHLEVKYRQNQDMSSTRSYKFPLFI